MVASIARQSVILKCLRQKSVLLGNYEFYYLAGLMKKLYGLELEKTMQPEEMFEKISGKLKSLTAKDEKEEYLLKMVEFYEPSQDYDEQMAYLFEWGEKEPDLWEVQTKYCP